MSTLMRRAGIPALVLVGALAGHDVAQAQTIAPNVGNNPYLNNRQYLYNLQVGRAALANSMVNPSLSSGIPYPAPAYNPYMAYGGNPYLPGTPGAVDPGIGSVPGSNPYAPISGAGDPYMSNPYSPYGGYGNPYYSSPGAGAGIALMGAADVIRSYGTLMTKQEEARIIREQYYSARLDNKKKKFDLEMYIKNNTPTFTEEQLKIYKSTQVRIQKFSSPAEIVDGRALNFLLHDVATSYSKTNITDLPLDDLVLKHLNVKPDGIDTYSLGILRGSGKLNWPSPLVDILSKDARADLEARAFALAQAAAAGKDPDRLSLKDLKITLDQTMDKLLKKANSYDTGEYMDAKRFLGDLQNARRAIETGGAGVQVQYLQMVSRNDITTVNTLVAAMVKNGWRFAPALQSDEAAYRALYSGMVMYNVALNQQLAQSDGN